MALFWSDYCSLFTVSSHVLFAFVLFEFIKYDYGTIVLGEGCRGVGTLANSDFCLDYRTLVSFALD